MKYTIFIACVFSFILSQAQEKPISGLLNNPVKQNDFVFDLENVLTAQEEEAIEATLRNFEKVTQSRLLIISVESTEDFSSFDQYCFKLIDEQEVKERLGKNGLALIFSGKLRKIHLNTEMERRKIVDDSIYERVVAEIAIPEFKNRNYYSGLQKTIAAILFSYND